MRRTVLATLTACLLAATLMSPPLAPPLQAQGNKPAPPPLKLKVGDEAPDFKLKYFTGSELKDVTLSEYRGKKNVVLAFYIFAFTGG